LSVASDFVALSTGSSPISPSRTRRGSTIQEWIARMYPIVDYSR
jgi:hypothetical protein